jgi:hypothetical protein
MKAIKNYIWMAALALTAATLTACSSDDLATNETPVEKGKVVTLTATLEPKDGATTRALTDNGNTVGATWAIGEELEVMYEDTHSGTPIAKGKITAVDGSGKATLSVDLIDPKTGGIYFHYPYAIAHGGKDNKLDQIGTLADIATNFDEMTDDGSLTLDVTGGVATLPDVALNRDVCIWKMNFEVGGSDITNTITALNIKVGDIKEYDISPNALSAIYVAMNGCSDQTITITAATPSGIYSCSKAGVSLVNGKFYRSTITLTAAAASGNYREYLDRTNFNIVEIPAGATAVTSGTNAWTDGTYVVSGNVTIDGNVTVSGSTAVNLILKDGASLTVNGTITGGNTLNIYGQELSSGKLTVNANDINVGVGNLNIHGGIINVPASMQGIETMDLNIYHGTVTTAGAMNGFMIMGDMHIYGGKVTASATGGAALQIYGSGKPGSLTVSGGTFMASGDGEGMHNLGILVEDGYGEGTASITITGGTVIASGGSDDATNHGGCGIEVCGNLTISGNAKVLAHGGMDMNGNGGGYGINVRVGSTAGGNATISGGTTTLTGGEGMAALNVDGDLTISGATTEIDAMGGLWMEGILAGGAINISGGNITARGGSEGGIGLEGTTTISGGFVTAIGGNGVVSSMENGAAGFDGSLTVNGGTFVATGGAKAGSGTDGLGISDGSTIALSGVTMYEGDAANPATEAASQTACTKRYVIIK